jgi:protein ImuB
MALPLAEALAPGSYTEPFDPVRDCRALYKLAVWCLRFSPLVGLDSELYSARKRGELGSVDSLHYGITIDLTGTERIHGDTPSFCKRLAKLFKDRSRIAVAPTIGGAWALSRYATTTPCIAPSLPALIEALNPLQTRSLRIEPGCVERLTDIGVYTINDLLALPRHTLGQRFGKQLLYRLNQALGSLEERLHTVTPSQRYARHKIFEPPLSHRRAITMAIEQLFLELLRELRASQISARSFILTLEDTNAQSTHKEFPLASATNDTKHLLAIIEPIIDSMRFCGEIHAIRLQARFMGQTTPAQRSFTGRSDDPSEIARSYKELLNSFSIRIGKDRVSIASLHHSYIPEHSFSYTSAITGNTSDTPSVMEHAAPYNLKERPSTLFAKPERITTIAMLPDKPPSFIQWRKKHLPIIYGIGPERIAPEWWRGDLQRENFSTRDYFTVQDRSGRWLWVFRDQQTQEWFVHGVWS